jgi:anti-sigma B factor antagonist
MKIEGIKISGIYSVKISGEISFREKNNIKDEFNIMLKDMRDNEIKEMMIDASGINYIDSLEIGFFVNLKKNMKKEGMDLLFTNVSDEVMTVFKLLSLEKVLCKK